MMSDGDTILDRQIIRRFSKTNPKGNDKCDLCGFTYNDFHAYQSCLDGKDRHFNFVCLNTPPPPRQHRLIELSDD